MKAIKKPERLCNGHYMIEIECAEKTHPGQFVSIKFGKTTDPLIRRPFSIFDHKDGKLEVVFKDAGRVTSMLKNLNDLSLLDIAGPYGKGFTLEKESEILMIGGGVGNAPLHYLGKVLRDMGCQTSFIYAARSDEFIYCHDRFCCENDSLHYVTDDGSRGARGYAADLIEKAIDGKNIKRAYICGPTVMMKSCAQVLAEKNIAVEVSLENYFGCGIGICSGCSVDTTDGKKRACVDGPVFDAKKINWNLI